MRVKTLELDLEWPIDMPLDSLRFYLLSELKEYGEPLRWSISNIVPSVNADCARHLRIEASVIIF